MANPTAEVFRQVMNSVAHAVPASVSDRDLLRRFTCDNDQAAFTALVRRHAGMVFGVCRRALSHRQDAEDASQATFLLLAQKAQHIRWQPSVANWLHATARKVSRNAFVAATRRAGRERQAAVPESVSALDQLTGRELLAVLDEELGKLPALYREPLVLCYLTGLTRDEAAAQMGILVGTLKIRLERGRKRLGEAVARRGWALGVGALVLAVTSSAEAFPPRLVEIILAAASGSVPSPVAALTKGVVVTGAWNKPILALLVLLGVAVVGIGLGSMSLPAAGQPPDKPVPAPVNAKDVQQKPDVPDPTVAYSGRVLGPDGKPAAGAKVLVAMRPGPGPDVPKGQDADVVGESAADGSFRVTVPASRRTSRHYLVAHAAGFGIDWAQLDQTPPGDVTFRLVKDVAITGRVVNTEGRPIAGVTVSASTVYVPAGDKLDDYLAGWKRNWREVVGTPIKRLYAPLDSMIGPVTTDKDGRFKIVGAGAERIVHVNVSGSDVARDVLYVITRPGFDPKSYNEAAASTFPAQFRNPRQVRILFGPDVAYVAEPGMTIEGVVKDAATGKPLAGCQLRAHIGFSEGVNGVSDKDGRYKLTGVPKDKRGYSVYAGVPKDSAYLNRNAHTPDQEGYAPVRLDVELVKGAVVTGRVIDKQTGKGVQSGVRFAPLADNKFYKTKPGYDLYETDRTMQETDAEGRFRLVTIPGRALVLAQAQEGEKFHGEFLSPYRHAAPDEADRKLFQYDEDDDDWIITTAGGLDFLMVENAVKVIDVKEDGETEVELFVDRGATGKITVQDADGQPLAGAWVAGLAEHWPITYKLPEPTATVYALNPEKPRTLAVYHPEKKLGGTVTIRGDEKEAVVAKLGPVGAVKGRLLDTDGKPLVRAAVSVNPRGPVASDLYRIANPPGEKIVTDKDGRFTVPGVVPGIKFSLQIQRESEYFGGKPKIGLREVKPGETLDLGDRTVELLR